jgi:hypothetical protein
MSTKRTLLNNDAGAEIASIYFDEDAHCWRIASNSEPDFRRAFSTEIQAFDFWHSHFDPQTGKLRH